MIPQPTSQADRAAINRANSQHSTGPKTDEGKQRSALNALRHGLTSHVIVMPGEDLTAYRHHVESFLDEYRPEGPTETQLVQLLADTAWRLNRVSALETNLLSIGSQGTRYPNSPEPIRDALCMAESLDAQTRALSNLSLHSHRLHRQFEKTLMMLRQTQSARKAERNLELNQAADLVQMHEHKKEPYNPSDDGFVFTTAEIATHIRLRLRASRAQKAHQYLTAHA